MENHVSVLVYFGRNISLPPPPLPFPGLDFALKKGQGRLHFHSEFYFTFINSTKSCKE